MFRRSKELCLIKLVKRRLEGAWRKPSAWRWGGRVMASLLPQRVGGESLVISHILWRCLDPPKQTEVVRCRQESHVITLKRQSVHIECIVARFSRR